MYYSAYRASAAGLPAQLQSCVLAELQPGQVLVRSHYAGINYKDALAMTGTGAILRQFPLTPGVDLAGQVVESRHELWSAGQQVLANGSGLGESQDGSFAEYVVISGDLLIALPENLSLEQAAILGTPSITAVLALGKLELNGLMPAQGPILVTGASGGVGMMCISLLASRGFEVVALTAKNALSSTLIQLGAHRVIHSLPEHKRPLASATWAGAIDMVGGDLLASIVAQLQPEASVVSVGLAGGSQYAASVMPFILRGVNVLGVTAANCSADLRRCIWLRLASDLHLPHLDLIHQQNLSLDELPSYCRALLQRQISGRSLLTLVE